MSGPYNEIGHRLCHLSRDMGSNRLTGHNANNRRSLKCGLMLGQRLRRWSNINPQSGARLLFNGYLDMLLVRNILTILATVR